MLKGKLLVNNSVVKQKVLPPSSTDALRLTKSELETVQAVKLIKGGEHTEKGFEFYVYAAKARSVDDVRKAYMKMRVKYGEATHISCGYQLSKPNGPFEQEGIDDKEFGCGRIIMEKLAACDITELAVFIVRIYRGVHLGARRFEIFKDMTQKGADAWFKFLTKKASRSQRVNSQDSLKFLTSQLSDEEITCRGNEDL